MSDIMTPRLGFSVCQEWQRANLAVIDEAMTGKIRRTGVEAARKRFTPEFINRLDEIVTFHPLGPEQLKKILDIELNLVQQRIFGLASDCAFVFTLSDKAKSFLLEEGTDIRYGARHLKRTIGRLLVQPMSNLITTEQVRGGDLIVVDFDEKARSLRFSRQAECLPAEDMTRLVEGLKTVPPAIHLKHRKHRTAP
jgi:ATP-dependent Clp protease ATP-binding subunit ClpA